VALRNASWESGPSGALSGGGQAWRGYTGTPDHIRKTKNQKAGDRQFEKKLQRKKIAGKADGGGNEAIKPAKQRSVLPLNYTL